MDYDAQGHQSTQPDIIIYYKTYKYFSTRYIYILNHKRQHTTKQ